MDKSIRPILIIFLFVLTIYLMTVFSSILIPLVLAFIFAMLFLPLILLMKKIKIPNWIILPVVSIISLAVIFGLFTILIETSSQIGDQSDYIAERLEYRVSSTIAWANSLTGMEISTENIIEYFKNLLNSDFLKSTAGSIAQKVSSFTGSFFMFALYYIVLLSGLADYKKYLIYISGEKNSESLVNTVENIRKSIMSYMVIKTIISLITGFLTFIICLIFGVKFAFFWGLLAFLLNFIPSIGSFIAIIPPALMAVIQYDSFYTIFFLILLLISVQMLMGNIIEPKIMGNRLSLNTITVIFGLVFWGYLWGIAGMFLSVPLLVIFKLILEHFPSLSPIARIMGYPDKQFNN